MELEWSAELNAVLDDDAAAGDPDFWTSYRSWEQNPPELQGLAINQIPWCYHESGVNYCVTITRHFWFVDWRERGEFQREHRDYRDGTTSDWQWWFKYRWGYDSDTIIEWDGAQNQRIRVPVACTGAYSCVHGFKFFNFADWAEKQEFQALHNTLQNDGTQTPFYRASYDWSDSPH